MTFNMIECQIFWAQIRIVMVTEVSEQSGNMRDVSVNDLCVCVCVCVCEERRGEERLALCKAKTVHQIITREMHT